MRNRLAIRYSVEGDLRFISHHDSLRLFERAMIRADFPLRYSEGFNQRPKLSIALPRPVGVASRDELLVITLTEPTEPSTALSRLSPHMPQGLVLLDAEPVEDSDRRLPCEATYTMPMTDDDCEMVLARARSFLASDSQIVERHAADSRNPTKKVDIRPYIRSIDVSGGMLRWTQIVTGTGTSRVGEILDLLGLPSCLHLHRLTRESVRYEP